MNIGENKAYLLLGLGIGIIVTNIVFYMNPRIENRDMTDQEIMTKAKDLGMVSLKENIEKNSDTEIKEKKTEKIIKEKSEEGSIDKNLVIEQGDSLYDVSEKLKKKNFIDDEKKFNKRVKERELTKSIRYGEYEIEKDSSYDDIINIITWKNRKKD